MDLTHSDMDFERGKKNPQTIIFVAERFLYNQNPNTGTELFQNGLCILFSATGSARNNVLRSLGSLSYQSGSRILCPGKEKQLRHINAR